LATGKSISPDAAIRVGNTAAALAVGDGSVWALNYYDATVTRIDPVAGRAIATVTVGRPTNPDRLPGTTPIRLAVTPGMPWVSDAQAGTLSRPAVK
jgi:hypothetical protein